MIQVYEDTAGLAAGEPVLDTGEPLQVELGPGLLGSIFDGTQRPLTVLARAGENPLGRPMIPRGVAARPRPRAKLEFEPRVEDGDRVGPGDVLGIVQETAALAHRILVPPGTRRHRHGTSAAAPRGWTTRSSGSTEQPLTMLTRWPVRQPRPAAGRLALDTPFITGQRVDRHALPARARRHRDDPRRLRHRQDRARAIAREVGARRRRSSTSPAASAATS